MDAITDVITHGSDGVCAQGSLAARLLANGMNPSALRTNTLLRKDEWIQFDNVVLEVARKRLIGVADLINSGLRFDIPNGLGITQVEWETLSDMDPAELTMSGVSPAQRDRVKFVLQNLPLPITHKDFSLNIRALAASRNLGTPLDTTMAALSARLVAEKIESILFKGATVTVSGTSIQGYTTATNRNTGTLTGDWFLAAQTGTIILGDILAMITQLVADNMFGPYWLYVPLTYFTKFGEDFKTNSDKSIINRLLEIPGLDVIKASPDLLDGGTGEVVLVQPTSDVVEMVIGLQPQTIEWETNGGMTSNFKVMTIMVPRIRNTQTLQSGIAHHSV